MGLFIWIIWWKSIMFKVLVSSCLLGEPVRYDGKSKGVSHQILDKWQSQGRIVSFCPEAVSYTHLTLPTIYSV